MKNENRESRWLKKTLADAYGFLYENKFVCLLSTPDEPAKMEYLLINLGQDELKREIILRLNFLLLPELKEEMNSPLPFHDNCFLQFVATLPFEGLKGGEEAAIRMITQLNTALEIPGFEFNEARNEYYFRYVYFSYEERMDKEWLLSMIMYIRTLFDLFASWIEKIAKKEITLEEFTSQWKDIDLKKV